MVVARTSAFSATAVGAYFGHDAALHEMEDGALAYFLSELKSARAIGGVAESLGIDRVDRETLGQLALGWAPDGTKLRQNAGNGDDAAWDLTLSFDKTVSLAYALGDNDTRAMIASHMSDMSRKVVEYFERTMTARRGHGGHKHEPIEGLLVVPIVHSTSRYGDIQLHIHHLVLNTCQRQDGTLGALHSRDLYKHTNAIGRLATAEDAAHWLSEGAKLTTTEHGSRFSGIPEGLVDETSQGRQAILDRAQSLGVSSPEAFEAINLDLRPPKTAFNLERNLERWREQGAAYGVDEDFIRGLFGEPQTINLDRRRVCARRAVREAIAETEIISSTFQAAEITQLAALKCRDGRAGLEDITRAVAHELQNNDRVTKVAIERGHQVYSTERNEALERQALEIAEQSRNHRQHVVDSGTHRGAVVELGLDPEQARAVRMTTTTKGSIKLLTGIAGTGKTRTLKGVRLVEEAAGRRLLGAAPTGVAREELRTGAGLTECYTVAKLLHLLDPSLGKRTGHHATMLGRAVLKAVTGKAFKSLAVYPLERIRLGRKDTIVLDEAAMVGFHDMTRLMKVCQRSGAKLVLCGDELQLGPVLSGASLFAELKRRLGASSLTTNWRQRKHEWLQQLNSHLVRRESEEALRLLVEKDRIRISRGLNSPLKACADHFLQHGVEDPRENLVIASTRAQVEALNQKIQEGRLERGDLGRAAKLPSGVANSLDQKIHVNDRVVLRRNDPGIPVRLPLKAFKGQRESPGGVVNGDFGTVVAAFGTKIRVLLDRRDAKNERQYATVNLRKYRDVELGYAVTAHRAQGRTVKQALLLADSGHLDAEQGYVAMTRQAEDLQVFAHEVTLGEELRKLTRALRRSRRQELATEARRRLDDEKVAQEEQLQLKLRQGL